MSNFAKRIEQGESNEVGYGFGIVGAKNGAGVGLIFSCDNLEAAGRMEQALRAAQATGKLSGQFEITSSDNTVNLAIPLGMDISDVDDIAKAYASSGAQTFLEVALPLAAANTQLRIDGDESNRIILEHAAQRLVSVVSANTGFVCSPMLARG